MNYYIQILTYSFLAIGISPLSSNVYGYNIKLPFLLLGVLMLLKTNKGMKKLIYRSLSQGKMRTMLAFLVFSALLGVITGDSISPVILDFMAIFFFFLFFWLNCRNVKEFSILSDFIEKYFIVISIYEFLVLITGISGSAELDDIRIINLVACPFFLSILYQKRGKVGASLLFFAVCIYMTIRGAMRINFLFPILYLLFLCTIFRNKNVSFLKKITVLFLIAMATIYIYPIVQTYIEADTTRYLHMVKRTEEIFDENDKDDTREQTNMLIINETEDFILPQGIGYLNHTPKVMAKYRSKYGVMSTMDSNLFYCVYHFGLLIGIGIIIMVFYHGFRVFIVNIKQLRNSNALVSSCFVIVVLSMFTLKSWIFVYSSFGLIYGLVFAYAQNMSNFLRNSPNAKRG